ncbi:MAG TPA: hypothetical protein VK988_17470, partial [Acidimicrobiales bacterium]|nr:hypothetical protein [Acidimicrobiales bacterium]
RRWSGRRGARRGGLVSRPMAGGCGAGRGGGRTGWCDLRDIGRRPVVVLSRDAAIARLRRTIVAPCTTTIRGLAGDSVA